jgi:hypothetical protein
MHFSASHPKIITVPLLESKLGFEIVTQLGHQKNAIFASIVHGPSRHPAYLGKLFCQQKGRMNSIEVQDALEGKSLIREASGDSL